MMMSPWARECLITQLKLRWWVCLPPPPLRRTSWDGVYKEVGWACKVTLPICPLFWYTVYDRLRLKGSYFFHQTQGGRRNGLEGCLPSPLVTLSRAAYLSREFTRVVMVLSGQLQKGRSDGSCRCKCWSSLSEELCYWTLKNDDVYFYVVDWQKPTCLSQKILA